jgi:GTPase
VKPSRGAKAAMERAIVDVRERLFFVDYAPVVVGSARTGENVDDLFRLIKMMRKAARSRLGTGVLNRLLRAAFEESPPPMIGTKRLKLFYATHKAPEDPESLQAVKIVLFVNQPKLLSDSYSRYLQRRIRAAWPFPGLPLLFSCRARSETT